MISENLDTCGCCDDTLPQPHIENRPGLPALSYRITAYGDALRRMLARLPLQTVPGETQLLRRPLAELATRAADDPSLALLDAWAVVADVLTFYAERYANEGYLRTATERRSLLELARAIGYELRPGVAAGTYLAFEVEDTPGAPPSVILAAGSRVQSVPEQGQLPQTFETTAALEARSAWNVLRPRRTQTQPLSVDAALLYFQGAATGLKPGDLLLIAARAGGADPAAAPATAVRQVRRVTVETALDRTRVDFSEQPAPLPPLRRVVLQQARISLAPLALTQSTVQSTVVNQSWSEGQLSAFFAVQGWSRRVVLAHLLAPPRPVLPPAEEGVFVFRAKAAPFGNNAPRFGSLPKGDNLKNDPYSVDWDNPPAGTNINVTTSSQGVQRPGGDTVLLDSAVPGVLSNTWIVLDGNPGRKAYRVSSASEQSVADFALSGKSTRVRVDEASGLSGYGVRDTTIWAASERLQLAELPIGEPVAAGDVELMLDRLVLGLAPGRPLALSGEREDLPGVIDHEVLLLSQALHADGFTTLVFSAPPAYSYVRATVALNANVAHATHGETVREALGSGNGARPNQRFGLRKPPLTYVSSTEGGGVRSTLELRVDGVLWDEAERMFGHGPADQVYIVRRDDDGASELVFGDGTRGARLPTGSDVSAVYRSGIGSAGLVDAGALTLLQTRPLGVRGVTNPLPAADAADPEQRDAARINAPLTVLTLDRIVSLADFEDFTRAFAGIGKARANVFWRGDRRLVHLTVGSAAETTIAASSPVLANLEQAIARARDPGVEFAVDTYQPLYFNLQAGLLIDGRYRFEDVRAAAEAAVLAAFGWAARGFAQPVTAAEMVAVLQGVPGVVAVDLDQLYPVTDDAGAGGLSARLPALPARWNPAANGVERAQLLLVNPAGIGLHELRIEN